MTNPWGQFPIPTRGDLDDAKTYEGVGRVMDQWESIEFSLARLHSIFAGDPDGPAISDYGHGRIFRERLTGLRRGAEQWFQKRPDQALEGAFDALCVEVEGFSERRNEVAHGVVFFVNNLAFFRDRFDLQDGKKQYVLIPPLYAFRNYGTDGLPEWAYSFNELWDLMARLLGLSIKIDDYRRRLLGLPPKLREP